MKPFLVSILLLGAAVQLNAAASTHPLRIEVVPQFDRATLVFDAMTHATAAGQRVSVTRLDFLLSNFALRRADGGWLSLTNSFAYVSAREGRTTFELEDIPAGDYHGIRFHIGLPADVNHANPAKHPPGHPLNPTVNGLHWSWQGGYVFFALEGAWETTAGQSSGYSYHIATDRHLATVELPLRLNLSKAWELSLGLDVARLFAGAHEIRIIEDTASTHSREGDALAERLRENLERAFLVRAFRPRMTKPGRPSRADEASRTSQRVEIAPNATPYAFTFSGFFPPPALPGDNPLTEEGVRLGALLFFDPRLSVNNAQSCATCHQREAAFSDAGNALSRGAEGQPGTRNAMAIFNLAWKSSFFWDGRTPSLREQVLQPIQNPIEMHETLERVVPKVARSRVNARHQRRALAATNKEPAPAPRQPLEDPVREESPLDYPVLFDEAFGTPLVTADRIARALEQFLLTRVSCRSKFDRFAAGETRLTAEEQRGFDLFHTEYDPRHGLFGADCFHCHGGPLLQNQPFANNGLDAEQRDPGRFLVTGKPGDKGKFAVPSLRNVALTAPYMHDGRFATLEEVIEHYSTGVKRSATLDPNLAKHPDGGVPLADADKKALVAFLKTLTDEPLLR